MRYRILGPIEVGEGTDSVPLGQGRQRLLLAVLLLHANEPVSSDRLIDALWGESPPPTAGRSLHNLVSGLRKALGSGALVTRGHGYELRVDDDELDARRFFALADRGRAALERDEPEHAGELLREALDLWRGPPLADVAYEAALQDAAARLEERRLEAIEDRIDAELALGRHPDLLIELKAHAAAQPTRERIRGQQMLALYRSGRQADALAVYADTRRHLVDELGIEPGPGLRRLEQAILEQDPALGTPDALPRAPRPRPRLLRPALLIVGGATVVAAVVAAVLASGSSAPTTGGLAATGGDSVAEIDPSTNAIVGEYPVGGTPTVISAADGAIWTINADGQTLSRIDQRSKEVRTSGIDSVPLDLAAAHGAVWVMAGRRNVEGNAIADRLVELDPRSATARGSTAVRPVAGNQFRIPPQLVAAGDDAVWAVGRTGWLHRVDPRTRAATIRRTPPMANVLTTGGDVWALGDGPKVLKLDPRTGAVVKSKGVPALEPGMIAAGGGTVWLTDAPSGVLWRVDMQGRPVVRTITLEEGVDSVAVGAGAVWAANSLAGTVTRIDPATNKVVKRIAVGNTPRAVLVADGHVWVAVAGGGRPVVPAAGTLRPGSAVTPISSSACGPVLTGSDGKADVLIGSELPLASSAARSTTQSMAEAIAFVVREHRFRAGRFRIALQTCDHSTAQGAFPYDDAKCEANAKAYAANRSVVGVIGPVHSGCAGDIIPIFNRAPGGPVALVSPANTAKALVRPDPTDPAGSFRKLYPNGQRGYARIMPTEDYEIAALAVEAKRLGHGSAFYLQDVYTSDTGYPHWFRYSARRAGLRIAGTGTFDPQKKSYRALAERVAGSGAPAVVVLANLNTNSAQMIRDLQAVLDPGVAIVCWSGNTPISDLFGQLGPLARGLHVSAGGPVLDHDRPPGKAFTDVFGPTQPEGRVTSFDAFAATATEVMLDAVARSDGTRASVTRALAQTRLAASPIGPIAFTPTGERTRNDIAFVRAEDDPGRIPYVYNDVTGGVLETVITVPDRLISNAR